MREISINRLLALTVSVSLLGFVSGCAHMEKSPPERKTGYAYIHMPLPEASRKVDEARAAGKDKACPKEFKEASDTVDDAYAIYISCRTKEGIAKAEEGINKLNALCPKVAPPPPPPAPVVAPPPPPPPAPAVSLSADPASVKQNRCANLTWSAQNASSVSIDQGVGSVAQSGTQKVCPESTTRYTITATGAGGTKTADTTVTVLPLSEKTMVFDTVALFDVDKAVLKPKGKDQIREYREKAQAELSRADKIKITGHTDSTGSAAYNQKLSMRRAEAVRDYLVSLGVDANKLEVTGEGESRPIADNGTVEGRAKNRRVEVVITGLEK